MSIETVKIKNKDYAMVHSRVNHFRATYAGYAIETDLISFDYDKGFCICKAIVRDDKSHIIATGIAHEFRDDRSSMVNKTSFVENAETSAIGRALACLGIGTEDSYASSFEVENAIASFDIPPKLVVEDVKELNQHVIVADPSRAEELIPQAVPKFGGLLLNQLSMEDLMELSTVASSDEWKGKIAHAMNALASQLQEFEGKEQIDKADVGGWTQ
jgi:hypothetical protein